MAKTTIPSQINGLIRYLSSHDEKADEDLALMYFRNLFPNFIRQSDAKRSDGYVPGHFVLELKGKSSDWFSGLIQGLAYKKDLDFSIIVVAAQGFLAIWRATDIPDIIQESIINSKGAPSKIGKALALKHKNLRQKTLKLAIWNDDKLYGLFLNDKQLMKDKIKQFENILINSKKIRQKITTKNFTKILKQMIEYFDPTQRIKAVGAFYAMIYSWDENSILTLGNRDATTATLSGEQGEQIKHLIPDKRIQFKGFVEDYYVYLSENENLDDFFSQYDKALDTVDKNFRIQNGIFFTDLDLSKFTMWLVKREIPELGKNYIVIDPACGSGNLVTNWRSPLQLRHKVVSEIEPELLYAVEKRMKGDIWHNEKFTVVPKIEDAKGLNFLDKSAKEYIDIINEALKEKGLKFDKPIAFLCNPPYRGDDDKTARPVNYKVNQDIINLVGGEGKAERYCCFLAQMKLICDYASESGLPDHSRLLLFTKSAWLTNRPSFENIRTTMLSSFDLIDGILVNSKEFFDVKVKFPIAFTIWAYNKSNANASKKKSLKTVYLKDYTWVRKFDLSSLPWNDQVELDKACNKLTSDPRIIKVPFGLNYLLMKNWVGIKRQDFIRSKRKSEANNPSCSGLPKGDRRLNGKCAYGKNNGSTIGFMDDLTPCRIPDDNITSPWFRLNPQFMDCNRNRCFSGRPTDFGYYANDLQSAKKIFLWYALARTFAQIGYPLWADALEIWVPKIPENLDIDVIKHSFAIGFAENECVETTFPANNPVKGAHQIYCTNPMAPTNKDSFWSQVMAPQFLISKMTLPDRLVGAVNSLYDEWKKRFKKNPEITTSYEKPYFIGEGVLKPTSGLAQIKDFAKANNDQKLMDILSNIQVLLKETKQSFYNLICDKNSIDYFGNQIEISTSIKSLKPNIQKNDVFEKRLVLASKIVKSLSESKSFGITKFAKVFFIADMLCGQNLKTNYYREAAGPVDYNTLYSETNKIELLANTRKYFTTKKVGKTVKFIPGEKISDIDYLIEKIFIGKSNEINRAINLFIKLDTEQSEIIATIFACWNDLLIEREEVTDQKIIDEVRNHWNVSKKRFSQARLIKALTWMRKNKLTPLGLKGHTLTKNSVSVTK